jgi:DNA primase
VLCLDGDSAGQRAAERALDLALPHLAPGRTIRLAYAPQGEDPDDIFRRSGAEALAALIAASVPASDALFEREKLRHGGVDTPEAQAAFQASLKESIGKIADRDTQRAFFSDLMSRANALVRAKRPAWVPNQAGGFRRKGEPAGATAELKAHAASHRPRPAAESFLRAAIDMPGILTSYGNWIERLAITDPELDAIRDGLLTLADDPDAAGAIDREALSLHLTRSGQERAAARISRWAKAKPPPEGADLGAEWLALATREVVAPAIREELAELRQAAAEGDDTAFARFQALSREAREIEARAREAKLDDVQEDDAGGLVA